MMAVYVDDMRAGYGRMVMCHMIADSHEELFEMARKIGVQHKWLQNAYSYREHFDICLAKRKLAVAAGAKEVTQKEIGRILLEWRKNFITA